jgi:hypothetical protein
MAKAGYAAPGGAAIALVAATTKTVWGVNATAAFGVDLKKFRISTDGVTATAVPILVEACFATFATNAPGTASTTITPVQVYGRTITAGFTAARSWTTEPTVLTPFDEFWLDPNKSTVLYDVPLGDTPDTPVSNGIAFRMNAPAAVNVRVCGFFERT